MRHVALAPLFLLPLAALDDAPSDARPADSGSAVEVFAWMDTDRLEVGEQYDLVVGYSLPEGASAAGAGPPAPFLQIDLPPSIELVGEVISEYRELTENEFLLKPFERLLEEPETAVPFRVVAEPAEGETIGLNVVGYVRPADGESHGFLRRRLELPVTGGAEAIEGDPTDSSWGVDEKLLQIGDRAAPFELPDPEGRAFPSSEILGRAPALIATYRAFW